MQAFKKTKKKKENYYKSSRPNGQPEWSVEVGPVAPSQQQIRNRTKRKENKESKTHLHNQKKENKTIPQLVSPQFRSESSDVIG